jgi:DNA replication initiation complex subunit (GINS family)
MYNELYIAWKQETDNINLGGLPRDFYIRLADYLKRIREENSLENKTVKANLLAHEAQNVFRMLDELLEDRCKKIQKTITDSQKLPSELLTIEEAKMSENLMAFTGDYKKFTQDLLQGKIQIQEKSIIPVQAQISATAQATATPIIVKLINESSRKRVVLRFIKNIPGIIGSDMKTYGPFAAEDVASLPAENAKMLVKQGLAVIVEIS